MVCPDLNVMLHSLIKKKTNSRKYRMYNKELLNNITAEQSFFLINQILLNKRIKHAMGVYLFR